MLPRKSTRLARHPGSESEISEKGPRNTHKHDSATSFPFLEWIAALRAK
jgi:hypothetical protein